jgi:hypothetical protein
MLCDTSEGKKKTCIEVRNVIELTNLNEKVKDECQTSMEHNKK